MAIEAAATGLRGGSHFVTVAGTCSTFWALDERRQIGTATFEVDCTGPRIALGSVESEPILVAASWERHGVRAFDRDGVRRWERKELRPVHTVHAAGDGDLVVAIQARGAPHVLDVATGETVAKLRGLSSFLQGPHDASLGLGVKHDSVVVLDTDQWRPRLHLPDQEGVGEAAFAPHALAVSGGLRLGPHTTPSGSVITAQRAATLSTFRLDGTLRWRRSLSLGHLPHTLAWDPSTDEWVAVTHDALRGHDTRLVRFSDADGEQTLDLPLADITSTWLTADGRNLITNLGAVLETTSGEPIWILSD